MDENILESVKAGSMTSDYTPFDQELIMYINTFLGVLNQLGVGIQISFRRINNN